MEERLVALLDVNTNTTIPSWAVTLASLVSLVSKHLVQG